MMTNLKNTIPIIFFRDPHMKYYISSVQKNRTKEGGYTSRKVKAAGRIIEDIRASQVYICDEYPSPVKFLVTAQEDVVATFFDLCDTIIFI